MLPSQQIPLILFSLPSEPLQDGSIISMVFQLGVHIVGELNSLHAEASDAGSAVVSVEDFPMGEIWAFNIHDSSINQTKMIAIKIFPPQ